MSVPAFLVAPPAPPILRREAPRCGPRQPRRKRGPEPVSTRPPAPPLGSPPSTGPQRHDLSVSPVDASERALTEAVHKALRTRRDAVAYVATAAELPAGVAGALLSRERAEDMLIVTATREAALRLAALARLHLRGARLVVAASRGAGAMTHAAMAANSAPQKGAKHRRAVIVVASVRALFHELSQSGHGRPWLRRVRFAVFADVAAMLSVGARTHLVAGLRAMRPAAHRKSLMLLACAQGDGQALLPAEGEVQGLGPGERAVRHVVPASLLRRLVRPACEHVCGAVVVTESAPVIAGVKVVLDASGARMAARREAAQLRKLARLGGLRSGNLSGEDAEDFGTEEEHEEEHEDWGDDEDDEQEAEAMRAKSITRPGDGAAHTTQPTAPTKPPVLPSPLLCETLRVDTAPGVYATLLGFCREAIASKTQVIAFFATGRLVELYASMARADGVAVHDVTRRSSSARRDAALDWARSGASGALFASDVAVVLGEWGCVAAVGSDNDGEPGNEVGGTYTVRRFVPHVVQVGLPARTAYAARTRLVRPGGCATLLVGAWEADGVERALLAEGALLSREEVALAERATEPWSGEGVDMRMRSKAYCASVTYYVLERTRLGWKDKKATIANVNEWATQLFGAVPGAEKRIIKKMWVGKGDGVVVRATEVVPRNKHLAGTNKKKKRQLAREERERELECENKGRTQVASEV